MAADPYVAQLQALLSAQSQAERGQVQTGARQAYIDFGADIDPSFGFDTGYFSQDIDATTRSLAQQNTQKGLSQTARMQKEWEEANLAIKNDLAARGLLDSGELGSRMSKLQTGQRQQLYDVSKNVLDYMRGLYSGFQTNEGQRRLQVLEAQQSASQREQDRQFQLQQIAMQQQAMAAERAFQQQQLSMQAAADAAFAASMGGGDMGGGGAPAPITVTPAERDWILSIGTGVKRDALAGTNAQFADALHRWRMGGGAVSG